MDMVLWGLTWTSMLIYIHDIVVYVHSHADLQRRLSKVFQRLGDLKLKTTKVRLFQCEIKFLRHRVSAQGVAMNESNVMEIIQWQAPRNIHETRLILGLCSYYCRYMKDFVAHAFPLHEVTKNNVEFI